MYGVAPCKSPLYKMPRNAAQQSTTGTVCMVEHNRLFHTGVWVTWHNPGVDYSRQLVHKSKSHTIQALYVSLYDRSTQSSQSDDRSQFWLTEVDTVEIHLSAIAPPVCKYIVQCSRQSLSAICRPIGSTHNCLSAGFTWSQSQERHIGHTLLGCRCYRHHQQYRGIFVNHLNKHAFLWHCWLGKSDDEGIWLVKNFPNFSMDSA